MTDAVYDDTNIFAKILRGELPCQKVYEDDETMVIMDIMPRADGHCLVLPKKPMRNIFDADDASLAAVSAITAKMARIVKDAFQADGVTIQQFNEPAGGQVVFHLHVHVMPRMNGVALRPHTGDMETPENLSENADKIRAKLNF
ncbi:MAG: HIT family protein [Hyphomicrobiales bacterium]|nr:HIT family protein [Hyphomicrobiales bacterium]PCH49639.1 MAG: HIT family protein [Hyphomicrobiales bacterium]